MTKKFEKKLVKLNQTWSRYRLSKGKLEDLKSETGILQKLYADQSAKIALEMRNNSLNEVKVDDSTYKLKRIINARIIDRAEADQYDQEFNLGLFQKSICGPRVKSWVNQQIEKNLKVPDFVNVIEVWTIDIQ